MGEDGAGGWAAIGHALVDYVAGARSAEATRTLVASAALAHALPDDAQLERLLRALDARAEADALGRDRAHRFNNAVAGVRSNLDFLTLMLDGEAIDAPFLVEATVDDRANLLQALRFALESTAKLQALGPPVYDGGAR